ncbi:glycosyltransferase [Clostridium sp. MB40-C1]|uniref:glycosyltransferase n=1 Tax=Clostridium sp. MB40-C1 TaxID=3070996 RepID=UPI0027E16146|nr:glycosyltransferase [Clostridium sp. MB40-C1]WMJ81122.1 glycosyltransferase [Clostridium sp. MB40-C1]
MILGNKKKIVFFVLPGLGSFINDIINFLSEDYDTKKIIVTHYNQVDEGMEWADICWFEWCDPLIIYGSNLDIAKEKKIICRLHSYESFTDSIYKVNWDNVDKLIFVANSIRDIVLSKINLNEEKTIVIPNGVDLDRYTFKNREDGFNIAFIGYIDFKKGPMLLCQTFKKIFDKDNRYKLYIAGKFNEERYLLYFNQMIREMGLENNVIFDGWQSDINKWLEDKNYILCTSVLESQNMSVMQAMSKGIKPIIHNFVGAKEIYPKEYVWNSIDEAVNMINDGEYSSIEYRNFVESKFQLTKTNYRILKEVIEEEKAQASNSDYKVIKNSIEEKNEDMNIEYEIDMYNREKNEVEGELVYKHSNNKEKITVVTPMYNASGFLENLFSCISKQTVSANIEWILVDDGSKDDSLQKSIKLESKYKDLIGSIKIYKMKKNFGATSALYFGFQNSSTDYVAWISADDLYVDEDKLEKDIELLSSNNYDVVFSNKMMVGENLKNAELLIMNKDISDFITSKDAIRKLAYLTYFNPINGSSLVFSKKAYEKCGGFDKELINVDGDWDLLSRAFLCNLRFVYDDRRVFNASHIEQISKNKKKMLVGSSITRLRVLNILKDRGKLDEFLSNIINYKFMNGNVLMIRPIFSYFLIQSYGQEVTTKYSNFINEVETTFGKNNLEEILNISKKLMDSQAFRKFKSFIK